VSAMPENGPRGRRPTRLVSAREVTLVVFIMGFLVSVGVGVILSSAEAATSALVVTVVVCAAVFAVVSLTRARKAS
jgi:hypothetical protein